MTFGSGEIRRLEVGWGTLWRIAIFVAVILMIYFVREVVGMLLVAMVLALGLDPFVSFLEKRKFPRLLGTIIVFFIAVLLLVTALYLVVPVIVTEATGFIRDFNKTFSEIFGFSLPENILKNFSLTLEKTLGALTAAHISVTGAIGTVFSKLVLVVSTIIVTFYLTVQRDGVERLLRLVLPSTLERSVLAVFNRFKIKIRRWLVAQLGLSLIVGLLVGFGMWILGVRYPFVLGALAALFEIVPLIGPVVTGAVAFMIALSSSLNLGLYAVLFFIGIQQFENHVLIPLVMGKTMKVHPVIVIISLLAGASLAGFVGMLLSVPIAVLAQEVLNYLAERRGESKGLEI
ncbi:MAG: AI-2E family transporter [Patescibacteria group bacterium]|nr:AI-2E family transporter [Patescibacteria group bacterium]